LRPGLVMRRAVGPENIVLVISEAVIVVVIETRG
jgi:hypothetical protein